MFYKVILTSEGKEYSISVSPSWLLATNEEDLVKEIIFTSQCGINYNSADESGEPHCYGECVDRICAVGYQIIFEVE